MTGMIHLRCCKNLWLFSSYCIILILCLSTGYNYHHPVTSLHTEIVMNYEGTMRTVPHDLHTYSFISVLGDLDIYGTQHQSGNVLLGSAPAKILWDLEPLLGPHSHLTNLPKAVTSALHCSDQLWKSNILVPMQLLAIWLILHIKK